MANHKYRYVNHPEDGIQISYEGNLNDFNTKLLNIGELKKPSKPIEVLSIIFDLEGFTKFSGQVDPQLMVPMFISDFFEWLFNEVKSSLLIKKREKLLWAELPFFSKFMGDGVLFLWRIDLDKIAKVDKVDTYETLNTFICNIVATMNDICDSYPSFYDKAKGRYSDIPVRLRCGIARGIVVPIGGNKDFVGPCINISSRLQKLNGLSFVFSARGIDESCFNEDYKKRYTKKRVNIRGVGDNELVYMLNSEYERLLKDQQALFKEP